MMRLSLPRIPHCFSLQLCWIAAVARSLLGAGAARGSLEPEFEAMAACMDGFCDSLGASLPLWIRFLPWRVFGGVVV